jgi:competence protein ComEC
LDSARTSSARSQTSARLPLLSAALVFASGLWIGRSIGRPASWWVVAASVFLLSAIYFIQKKKWIPAASILTFSAIFAAGALTIQIQSSPADDPALWSGGAEQVLITAHVIAEGDVQSDGPGSFHQRIDVQTEKIESGEESRLSWSGVRLNIYSQIRSNSAQDSPAMRMFHYGERIRFPATVIAPRNYRNPGAFDYAGYLRKHSITATASAKYGAIESLPGFSGGRIELSRTRIHRSIIQKIHALWPEQIAALMDAIVIGEESFIERQTRVDFQRSGTYHVLVVSGMNVSILAMFALWSLRKLGLGDIAASMCAIALILAYAALTNVISRTPGRSCGRGGIVHIQQLTSARAIRSCWYYPKGTSFWWMPADCRSGRIRNSTSAKMWSRRICGRVESRALTRSRSPTHMPITWGACWP